MASLEHKLGSALAVCSESEARTLQFRRAERALSVGLEVECWLPDLRRVLPKLRSIRSNEELFAAVAEAEPAVLSARGVTRVLRVALTIADLAGRQRIGRPQLSEALAYRRPPGPAAGLRAAAGPPRDRGGPHARPSHPPQ